MSERFEEKLPDGGVRVTVKPAPELQVQGGSVDLSAAEYEAYRAWRNSNGGAIQAFLPQLDDDRRELLLSGLTQETWTQVFGGGPE
jgi:hypothetical protein